MSDPPPQRHTQAAIFRRAVLTCLLNPNAYAFMLAAFPAFMQPAGEPLTTRALQLGSIIAATQVAVYGSVALFAASARRFAGGSAHARCWTARAVGIVLIAGSVSTLAFAWRPLSTPAFAATTTQQGATR